ncbi:hypothetical protein SK128_021642 [Halocaridina rubra]|uniref:Uncharacterized protein n=1 Tax=Halocaridina rubra TaxID=373956 RepID=A0AAN8WWN6_HALRR
MMFDAWSNYIIVLTERNLKLATLRFLCGYFKRNRPEQRGRIAEDAQPLNHPNGMNGHNGHNYSPYNRPFYPGDEAL